MKPDLRRTFHWLGLSACLLMVVGCSAEEEPDTPNEPTPNVQLSANTGKADGQSYRVKDFFKETLNLPINDLVDRASKLATDEVNNILNGIPFVDIQVGPTELFGLTAETANHSTINDLNVIVDGLLNRYGVSSLITQLNQTRRDFLSNSDFAYYAESEFSVSVNSDTSFSTSADDLDVQVGFQPNASLTARTVFAHKGNIEAVLRSPLQSARELRGFILPRDTDDLRNLLPGESIALSGEGVLGFNIGANLPIFSVTPVDHLVLHARFHIGARVTTSGKVDVQFMRGNGSELVMDIGLTNARNRRHRIAIESGFGLEGLPAILEVSVGNKQYSLGSLAETLIERRLARSGLLSYGVSGVTENSSTRHSIQRFRIDLNTSTAALDAAIKQASAGDLRLMQTLADRETSGVTETVSFERGIREKFKHLGAHLSSMRFFSSDREREGVVVIRNGDTVQELLFKELETQTGRFFTDWGFRRLILTSQSWKNGQYQGATSNVRLAVSESDSYTDRDQVLDHVDTALLSVLDFGIAYTELTQAYEVLQHEVDEHCDDCRTSGDRNQCESRYRDCVQERITDSEVVEWRQNLENMTSRYTDELTNTGYNQQFDNATTTAKQLLALKLHLSSVQELPVALADVTGRTSILSDMRMSQAGMNEMFRRVTPDIFRQRLVEMLTMIVSKRSRNYDQKYEKALDWVEDEADLIDDMMSVYEEARQRYIMLDDASRINVAGGSIGDGAFIVTPGTDEDQQPTMLSIAEQKAMTTAHMIERLVDRGQDLSLVQTLIRVFTLGLADPRSFESHHLIAYTLISLIDPQHREWMMSLDFEKEDFTDIRLYSRGTEESGLIEVGEFNLDTLISD